MLDLTDNLETALADYTLRMDVERWLASPAGKDARATFGLMNIQHNLEHHKKMLSEMKTDRAKELNARLVVAICMSAARRQKLILYRMRDDTDFTDPKWSDRV